MTQIYSSVDFTITMSV